MAPRTSSGYNGTGLFDPPSAPPARGYSDAGVSGFTEAVNTPGVADVSTLMDQKGPGEAVPSPADLEKQRLEAERRKREQDRLAGVRSTIDDARARQQSLIDRMYGIANGQIESPAAAAFKQQLQQSQQAVMGAASDARDVGPGGQMRAAQQGQQAVGLQGARDYGILQEQQKQSANQMLLQLYDDQRAADASAADFWASMQNAQTGMADSGMMADQNRNINDLIAMYGDQNQNAMSKLGLTMTQQGAANSQFNSALGAGAGVIDSIATGMGAAPQQARRPTASLQDMNKPSYGWGGLGA